MKNNIKMIVNDAMFIAIILLFTFVDYLGYINIGFVSFTTIHIIVILGASLYGWKRGFLYGFVMGVFSLLKAIQYPGTGNYFFLNPFISVLPRILFGLLSGLYFDILRKKVHQRTFNILLVPSACLLTFFHTLFVLTCWYVFGILDPFYISKALGIANLIENNGFIAFVGSNLALGSLFEIIAAGVIAPPAYIIINKIYKVGGAINNN